MIDSRSLAGGVCKLVFTDLDGSLLDHHSYSFEPARGQLCALADAGVPVIPTTSKTRPEIEALRDALGNVHPFIAENGAAIFVPEGYFDVQPAETDCRAGYWVREMVAGRAHWVALLDTIAADYANDFEYFSRAGTAGIMAMTGLDEAAAARANQRDYSEPVQWRGDADGLARFIDELRAAGAAVNRGGRFLAVSGDCDKGRAVEWLASEYVAQWNCSRADTLAIGDSDNDRAMLEIADTALLVRSPAHSFPSLVRDDGVLRSQAYGPAGWAEGVADWLAGRRTA